MTEMRTGMHHEKRRSPCDTFKLLISGEKIYKVSYEQQRQKRPYYVHHKDCTNVLSKVTLNSLVIGAQLTEQQYL